MLFKLCPIDQVQVPGHVVKCPTRYHRENSLLAMSAPPTVFVSHSHVDHAAALALVDALRAVNVDTFLDARNLHSGDRWLDALQVRIADCTAFVVLVGSQGVQRWVGAEVSVALNRHLSSLSEPDRLPIHPVLLGDTSPEAMPPFLALFQSERWDGTSSPPTGLLDALKSRRGRADERARFDGCPYVGLAAFQQRDANLFFGRRAETLAALAGLGDQQQRPPELIRSEQGSGATAGYRRWLQIEGASGTGKSSLVRAGLLPLVKRGALWPRTGLSSWTVIGPLQPGKRPLERLAESLEIALQPDRGRRDIAALRSRLIADARALTLHLRGQKESVDAPDAGWLLVIDQFEELFTLADEGERAAFDAALAEALADPESSLFVLSTVRSDFLDRIELLPRLAAQYNSRCQRHLLGPISREGLREVIELPAQMAGLDVSEVSTAILQDADGEPGALPLVENALRMLWLQRRGSKLSGEIYQKQGGLVGMLSGAADALLARIGVDLRQNFGSGHDRAALELLLALVKYDAGGRHTRRRITREEAVQIAGHGHDQAGERALAWLSGQRDPERPSDAVGDALRLVVIHMEGGTSLVDLIHETLVRVRRGPNGQSTPYWKTLADYVEANRERDTLRQQLAFDMEPWLRAPPWRRILHLVGISRAWAYRRLRLSPRIAAGRFVSSSIRWGGGVVVVLLALSAVVVESVMWALANKLPLSYVFIKPLWMLGWTPVPETVPIAPPKTGRYVAGCLPGRDDRPGTHNCNGRPEPEEVALPAVCRLGKHEVTFLQFDRYVWATTGRGYPSDEGWGRLNRPVINVTLTDAEAYVAWLNLREPHAGWRLPTETEWEFAARAGHTGSFPWGNLQARAEADPKVVVITGSEGRANYEGAKLYRTSPVGSFEANGGLHDMAGNVWEWLRSAKATCCDQLGLDEHASVIRGGSWKSALFEVAVAQRVVIHGNDKDPGDPPKHGNDIGFRVCRGPAVGMPASAPQSAERQRR